MIVGEKPSRAVTEAWRNKGFRLCVIATAFILAAGLSFAVGRVFGLGNTAVHSAIPAPLKGDDIFVEDQEAVGQDNLSNALESTGQGMVHVLSGGTSVGIGLVLTQSGKVLTTYLPSAGAANLSAEYVFSRKTFKATVIGVDQAAGLALLQMEGSNGRAFSTVTVGNSDTIGSSAAAVRESLLPCAGRGHRQRGQHHGHGGRGVPRCRHPDHPEYDRRHRPDDLDRADGVDAAVCAAVGAR